MTMEISYVSVYELGSRPRAIKRITDSSGKTIDTPVAFEFASEVTQFTVKDIYEHLDNLAQYIKDTSVNLRPIPQDEAIPEDGWHWLGGWGEIQWANDEAFKWWRYVYYRDDEDYVVTIPQEFVSKAE
jgi:hypothetical protein